VYILHRLYVHINHHTFLVHNPDSTPKGNNSKPLTLRFSLSFQLSNRDFKEHTTGPKFLHLHHPKSLTFHSFNSTSKMEMNTFSPPNDSSRGNNIKGSVERAETSDKTPKRDLTLKCKGQTILGKQCQQYVGELGRDGYCHFHLHLSNSNPNLTTSKQTTLKPYTPRHTTPKSATPKPANIPINAELTPPPSGNKKEKRARSLKCKGQSQDGNKCEQYVGISGRNGYCHFHLYQEKSDFAPEGVNSRKGKDKELPEPQQAAQVRNYLEHRLLGSGQEGVGVMLNQQVLNQQPLNEQPSNQEMLNQHLLNQEGLNLHPLEIPAHHPLNQHLLTPEALLNHPLNYLRINPNLPVSFWNLYSGPPTSPVTVEEHLNLVGRPVVLSALANRRRDNGQDRDPPTILDIDKDRDGGESREGREVLGMNSASTDPVLPVYYPAPREKEVFCPHCLGRRYADEEELWRCADGFACPVTRDLVFTECPEVMGANRRL
jgi:hypothetical protein